MTIDLDGSPYSFEDTGGWVWAKAAEIQERVDMLREQGKLSEQTLRAFFGDTRFRQIAESNAIEGSPLSAGETELAVLKGVTITGHDPAYSKDAVNLSKALDVMVELARDKSPTTLDQVKQLHNLILGSAPDAGLFRSQPVRIAGSDHHPPESGQVVMSAMEDWEGWSSSNEDGQALLRAIVLHTWLTHVHPFTDGNGRTSRAVMNLELIRAGLPSVIIRRKDHLRYCEALAESDLGGDLGPISELILARTEDALRELERTAAVHDDYDAARAKTPPGSRAAGCDLERRRTAAVLAGGRRPPEHVRRLRRSVDPLVRRRADARGLRGAGERGSGGQLLAVPHRCESPPLGRTPLARLDRIPEPRDEGMARHRPRAVDLLVDP